jgi:hypothetical protein
MYTGFHYLLPLNQKTFSLRKYLLSVYCFLFIVITLYKWYNGLLLSQFTPEFIYIPQDLTAWLVIATGLTNFLIHNEVACLIADFIYIILPFFLLFFDNRNNLLSRIIAWLLFVYHFLYLTVLTIYPTYSPEVLVGWMLFPVLFTSKNDRSLFILANAYRYFFCYIMASAAAWKLFQHGIFYPEQMNGIIKFQHADIITADFKSFWYRVYSFLHTNEYAGRFLYTSAALIEASFLIGFCTKKYDKWLRLLLITFISADFLIMRIVYIDYLIFALVLPIPDNKTAQLTPFYKSFS